MKKKNKQLRKIWILAWIIASFLAGYILRNEQGWTAKMPEDDEPPVGTYKGQTKACTTEWTDTQQIIHCKMYDTVEYNEP